MRILYMVGVARRRYNGPRTNGRKVSVLMIRAIVQNGLIRPLEPLPAAWIEGHPVIVEDTVAAPVEDLDAWYRELQALGPAVYDPGEWERVQTILIEADEQAKALVRHEMGSS
jgi:hypothetical protein